MKKALLFIGLKIVEITAFIFIPYWLGHIPLLLRGVMSEEVAEPSFWAYMGAGYLGLVDCFAFSRTCILCICRSWYWQ